MPKKVEKYMGYFASREEGKRQINLIHTQLLHPSGTLYNHPLSYNGVGFPKGGKIAAHLVNYIEQKKANGIARPLAEAIQNAGEHGLISKREHFDEETGTYKWHIYIDKEWIKSINAWIEKQKKEKRT